MRQAKLKELLKLNPELDIQELNMLSSEHIEDIIKNTKKKPSCSCNSSGDCGPWHDDTCNMHVPF